MEESVAELLELLDLQSQGQGVFLGAPSRDPFPRVYGGQLLGQSLAAASFTAPPDWPCHSLHAYFVRPGKPGRPIEYEVSAMRDGQRFATRKVIAMQRGEVVFELIASFEQEEPGSESQEPMASVPAPESFPPEAERLAVQLAQAEPERRPFLERRRPFEHIEITPRAPEDRTPSRAPVRHWVRLRDQIPSDPILHRCALAHASDAFALEASLRAIGAAHFDPELQIASLDHALWFHRPVRVDDWLLFSFENVSVAAGRGLSRGTVHTRDGKQIASIAQEGLLRNRGSLVDSDT
jgi:acyl-CoA thioesterase II